MIDSGVHAAHPHVGQVAESASIDPPTGDTVDRLGHGTAVASAIRDIAPGVTLIVGKIFDRQLSTNALALAEGVTWAVGRGARLINLSLGTANHAHEEALRQSVAKAADAGALVVSAREADGIVWLPGSLRGALGVIADPRLERDEIIVGDDAISAAPFPRPIPGVPKERNLSGVSFAVANVTGFLARLLEGRVSDGRVADLLRELRSSG